MTSVWALVFIFCCGISWSLQLGEQCVVKSLDQKGKCVIIDQCPFAINLLKKNQKPDHCGFQGSTPIVCCPTSSEPPGTKSKEKCGVYKNAVEQEFGIAVFGGKKSLAKEFPHMTILGYGGKENIQWLCGGSLISEQFILTAAHCVFSQEFGQVKFARLGDLDIRNVSDDARPQDFGIVQTFIHPEYNAPSHYNDIALLQLNKQAQFDKYVKPACLFTESSIPNDILIATGWGKTDFLGEPSSHLLKVDLNYIQHERCAKSYTNVSKKKLANGIQSQSQICAGHPEGKDTCPGDSGGPLQIKMKEYFAVVGVTSFGKACGIANSFGVYTRVSYFVPWIENIVWPK